MNVAEHKKHEYWNHFVARFFLEKVGGGHGVTATRLRRVKVEIWEDSEFWQDIVWRHGGNDVTPEQMQKRDEVVYQHCLGNFWGMIYQNLAQIQATEYPR